MTIRKVRLLSCSLNNSSSIQEIYPHQYLSRTSKNILPTSRKRRPHFSRGPMGHGAERELGAWGKRDSKPVLLAALKWIREVVFHKAGYRVHSVLKSRIFGDGVLIMEKKGRFRRKKSRRSRCPSFALSRRHENASRYSN